MSDPGHRVGAAGAISTSPTDERAEQHRLLLLQVGSGSGEERLHRRRHRDEAGVEDVHKLVTARGDEVGLLRKSLRD